MDKIKINNQIVQMRKYVKQAKVHVINRMVKEAKLLQNRKGNEAQVEKAKRKAERLLTEVAMIKKIKPDSISKLAISKALDWKAVLEQKNSTLEDRCIAKLANYEPVQKEVDAFYSNNNALVQKIPVLLKEWEERSKRMSELPVKNVKASEIRQKKKEIILKSKLNKSVPKTNEISKLHKPVKTPSLKKSENNLLLLEDVKDSDLHFTHERRKENAESRTEPLNKNLDGEKHDSCSGLKDTGVNSNDDESLRHSSCSNSDDSHISSNEKEHFSDNCDLNLSSNELEENHSVKYTTFVNLSLNTAVEKKALNSEELSSSDKNLNTNQNEQVESEISISNHPLIDNSGKKDLKITKQIPTNKSDALKTIKVLNLDELKDCDEIPVESSGDEKSSCEENADQETSNEDDDDGDPFFLREGKDINQNEKSENYPKHPFEKNAFEQPSFRKTQHESFKDGLNRKEKRKLLFSSSQMQNKKTRSFERYQMDRKSNFRLKNYESSKRPDKNSFHSGDKNFSKRPDRSSFQSDDKKFSKRPDRSSFGSSGKNFSKRPDRSSFGSEGEKFSPMTGKKDFEGRPNNSKVFYKMDFQHRDAKASTFQENKTNFSTEKQKPTEYLHPSWEAKKRLKEATQVQFQGKRTVFND